jgi:hypothetical protein
MVSLRHLALVALALMARPALADPAAHGSTFSIRVHNYAEIDEQQLLDAQRDVSDAYARCGVRAEWRTTVHPARVAEGREHWPTDPEGTLTLIVITEAMAARSEVKPHVAGYAATNGRGHGTIAFVVGDRTAAIAARARVGHARVLAAVMTHELAHLLMPRAHGRKGVMRARWAASDFAGQRFGRFSTAEANRIQRSVSDPAADEEGDRVGATQKRNRRPTVGRRGMP